MVYYGWQFAVNAIDTITKGIKIAMCVAAYAHAAATAAQYGLNTAMYACTIVWIIVLIIALIALAFSGNIFVALWNLVVDVFVLIYNLVAEVANFIGNVFIDPVGAICRLFFGLADTVLGILQALASAIDAIFGSNLAGMLMYGKEARNRKQEIDRQHHTIPIQRPKDKHCRNVHNRLWNHG